MRIVLPLPGSRLPPRGSRARLPFLLVPMLAGMAVVQMALPERIDLPAGGAVTQIGAVAVPDAPPMVIAPPLLAGRDLFAPPAIRGGPDSAGDPLGGAVIAGVIQKGRLRLGVVQQANGHLRYVAVGGDVAGWRLAALDQGEARLTHGPGQNLLVAYGMHASPLTNGGIATTGSIPAAAGGPQPRSFVSPQMLESGQ